LICFIYFYKKSKQFKRSIISATITVLAILGGFFPTPVKSKEVEGFTPNPQYHSRSLSNSNFKIFGSKTSTNNKKNPSGSDSGSGYDGCEYGNLPYFEPEPIQKKQSDTDISETEANSNSFNYKRIMNELERKRMQKNIQIEVGDKIYKVNNPNLYNGDVYELSDLLADQLYDSIRQSDTDISDIANNLNFKFNNIKDHVFSNEHDLDLYGPIYKPEGRY
jgi:hypothetical protein